MRIKIFLAEGAIVAANEIQLHMSKKPEKFPEGSTLKPSEALPFIWADWDEFVAMSDKLKTDTRQFAEIVGSAKNADAIKVQFGIVGESFGICHQKLHMKK